MNKVLQKFQSNHLYHRLLSALVLIPLVLLIFIKGKILFTITFIGIAVLMAFEWSNMIGHNNKKWHLIGLFYIIIPISCILYIRNLDNGLSLIIYLFLIIWATDTAAYIFGIIIGGPKIAPFISPSKSWAGCIGGLIAAAFVSTIFVTFDFLPSKSFILLALLISLVGQLGDLLESYFKRIFYIKDSGDLIPGHGGILDRMDSVVTAAPLLAIVLHFGVLQ